jgi:hypothetical protein
MLIGFLNNFNCASLSQCWIFQDIFEDDWIYQGSRDFPEYTGWQWQAKMEKYH